MKKEMVLEGRTSGMTGGDLTEVEQAIETIQGLVEAAELESVKNVGKKKARLREKRRQLKV